MLKKRLIFILYYDSGAFYLSRNFRLQRVGDVRWLVDKFRFKSIGRFIDEVVILDVSRNAESPRCGGDSFTEAIHYLMRETFVPLTIGGGVRCMADVRRCFDLGADKILFNTPVLNQPDLVSECVALFGAQAVVGAIDAIPDGADYMSKISNGQEAAIKLDQHLQHLSELGVGEILVNSINRDGTGMGFDRDLIERCQSLQVPLIVSGGAGKPEHFAEVLSMAGVEAAATGNLFNFIGKGFEQLRGYLLEKRFPVRNPVLEDVSA